MKKTYNGIGWIGHITDVENNQSSTTIVYDIHNKEAQKFVCALIKQCEDFVALNKQASEELERDRKLVEEYE